MAAAKDRKRKVVTAWLKPILYPPPPVRPAREPEDEQYLIRFKISKLLTLQDPGGLYPMQHLLCRCRMLFYGYGRLQKLCHEIGARVPDICVFGVSVYKDARAYMMDKLTSVHAAHLFPVTDFEFKTIEAKLKQVHGGETPDQIAKRLVEIETILTNMVGQTDFVLQCYNVSGTVGTALDKFLISFIRADHADIHMGNVQEIVNALLKCLRGSLKSPAAFEIGETIKAIEAADPGEWIRYYAEGLDGKYDAHYSVPRRTIDEGFKETLANMRNPE